MIVDANDPRCVIVKKLALVVEGRDDMEMDLTGEIKSAKNTVREREGGDWNPLKKKRELKKSMYPGIHYKGGDPV